MTYTALIGGSVAGHPGATGLVIHGRRIVNVGVVESKDLPPGTAIHHLGGGHVNPSFYDAHAHPISAELNALGLALDAMNHRELLAATGDAGGEGWVVGHGWDAATLAHETPSLLELDLVQPSRPVLLVSADGHSALVNTVALKLAGLLDPRDPAAGFVDRDTDGNPTGLIHDVAKGRVRTLVPPPSPTDLDAALDAAQRRMFGHGITGWLDALVGRDAPGTDVADAYRRADQDGRLAATVRGALWWRRDEGVEQVDRILNQREWYTGSRFSATAVKMMLDGTIEGRTAALLEPYVGSSDRGASLIDPHVASAGLAILQREGFDVHFHAIGDRAVREALDAIEASPGRDRGARHQIAHLQLIDPADVPRFRSAGVIAVIQALWAKPEPQMIECSDPLIGAARSERQYAFGSLHRAGARIAMGSDWPVTTAAVWPAITTALRRRWQNSRPLGIDQELDLATSISAYVNGSRFACRADRSALSAGEVADLVILDRQPQLAHQDGTLPQTRTLSTFVDGMLAYVADD